MEGEGGEPAAPVEKTSEELEAEALAAEVGAATNPLDPSTPYPPS